MWRLGVWPATLVSWVLFSLAFVTMMPSVVLPVNRFPAMVTSWNISSRVLESPVPSAFRRPAI